MMSCKILPEMRGDETKLILSLEGSIEETLHQCESVLLVGEHAAAINALQIQVEVSVLGTGIDYLLDLRGVLGQQKAVVDCLHGPDRHFLAHPFHGLRCVDSGSHCG